MLLENPSTRTLELNSRFFGRAIDDSPELAQLRARARKRGHYAQQSIVDSCLRLTKSTEARLIAERATRKGWVDKMYFSLCAASGYGGNS